MKLRDITEKAWSLATYASMFSPLVALGATSSTSTAREPLFSSLTEVAEKLCSVFQWVFTFALIVAFIYIVIAGIRYIMAGGNPEKVRGAHQALLWAVVGIAVALIARGVPMLIATFLEATVDRPSGC